MSLKHVLCHSFLLLLLVCTLSCSTNNKTGTSQTHTVVTDCQQASPDQVQVQTLRLGEKYEDYSRNRNGIFCGESGCNATPMPGVDTASFMIFPETKYAKDKNLVYYPLTIMCIDGKDCGLCFCNKYVVENGCAKSFRVLSKEFAYDEKRVYWSGLEIIGASPDSFTVVKAPEYLNLGIDAKRVYHRIKPLPQADPVTFYYDSSSADNDPELQKYALKDKTHSWIFLAPDSIRMLY